MNRRCYEPTLATCSMAARFRSLPMLMAFCSISNWRMMETSRTAVDRLPAVYQARVWHAAAAAQVGLEDEARTAAAAAMRLRPDLTIARFLNTIQLASAGDSERLREGLSKAGLPE